MVEKASVAGGIGPDEEVRIGFSEALAAAVLKLTVTFELTTGRSQNHVFEGPYEALRLQWQECLKQIIAEMGPGTLGSIIMSNPMVIYNPKEVVSIKLEIDAPEEVKEEVEATFTTGFLKDRPS